MRAWLPAVLCTVCVAQSSPADVIKAELAFAQVASEKGIRAAFMANLAEGSLVLGPEPVDARALYAKNTDTALLSWRPTAVGLSVSGDLAYTTGPWEYRVTKDAAPIVQGHFLSIWAKQPDGSWKVAFDCGVPHKAQSEPEGWTSYLPRTSDLVGGGGNARKDLEALDRFLSTGQSKLDRLAFGATLYRRGQTPRTSRAEVAAELEAEPARTYAPEGVRVARASDLGYAWGTARAKDGTAVSYLHIWVQAGGTWRLLYDLELPLEVPMPSKP